MFSDVFKDLLSQAVENYVVPRRVPKLLNVAVLVLLPFLYIYLVT